jgi:hypothetical protein
MTNPLTRCFAFLLLVLPFVPAVAVQPDDTEVERFVKQLGSADFRMRDAAAKRLQEIGEPALSALGKATTSDDGEVRRRAGEIAIAIEAPWKELKKLRKERLAALKDFVTLAEKEAYHAGKASYEEVRQASRLLREAELEQCASDKERLAVHEKALARAKDYEKITHMRLQAGVPGGTLTSALAARVNRLESEIAIEQAKAKAATQQPAKPTQTADVKALLKARAEAAQKTHSAALKSLTQTKRAGDLLIPMGKPEDVYIWSVRWLNAQRDLANKKEEQIAALVDHLRRMQELKQRVENLAKAGMVLPTAVNAVEFYRVEAEVWLAQEKAK